MSEEQLADLVMVVQYEDHTQLEVGDVCRLAEILQHRQYGDISIEIIRLEALDPHGALVEVDYTVSGARDFDADSWAHPRVDVTLPDGRVETAYYTIDGRA